MKIKRVGTRSDATMRRYKEHEEVERRRLALRSLKDVRFDRLNNGSRDEIDGY